MPPSPLPCGAAEGERQPPLPLSRPGPAGKECHVFLFPINFPPPAALHILETRSQDGHGGGLGGAWRELRWWQALELKGGPQEPGGPSLRPQDPTARLQGSALTPRPFHSLLEVVGGTAHILREG